MIGFGLEQAGLCAMMMLLGAGITARMTLCARFTSPREIGPQVHKTASLRAAVAQQRALPKLRTMLDGQIAEYVVTELRASDMSIYPFLSEDLDHFILEWCDRNTIRRPSAGTIRELIKEQQGVTKKRVWLNMRDERHQFVRSRQSLLGTENPRPVLYFFASLDTVTDTRTDTGKRKQTRVRSVSNACLPHVQPVQTRVRTGVQTGLDARQQAA